MTTKNSPKHVLKTQALKMAKTIKDAERGDYASAPQFIEKLKAARDKESVKVAVVMDDKTLIIDIPWATIKACNTAGLAEYIYGLMKESRNTIN